MLKDSGGGGGDGGGANDVDNGRTWAAKSAQKHTVEELPSVTSVEDQPPSYFSAVSHEVDEVATKEFANDERVVSILVVVVVDRRE